MTDIPSIGMDFENQDKTLTAKKSYFILNDKIVFLGTGIKSTDSSKNPVYNGLKIAKRIGIRYIQTINKQPLPIIRIPISVLFKSPINLF